MIDGRLSENSAATEAPAPRREPVQKRSRERYERMLEAAKELITQGGSDAMKMSDIAARAGVPIGSLYQFFPDKASIVRVLAERTHAESRQCIEDGLAGAREMRALRSSFADLIDEYYAIFLAEPVMRDIWGAMQTDKSLAALELAESRRNGALLAEAIMTLKPDADAETVSTSALLIMHLGEATMRIALQLPPDEGRTIVDGFKRMADRELAAL